MNQLHIVKDLRVTLLRKVLTSAIIFILLCSGFANPAHADQLSDLQIQAVNLNLSFENLNAILQSNMRDGEKDVATLDNLNKQIVANQDQYTGAVISSKLDNDLQASKKALETVILNLSNQNNAIVVKMKSIDLAKSRIQEKIKILENGGTLTCDYMIDDASCQSTNKLQQTINYAYAGDDKSIFAMTTVLVDMIKANA